VDGREVDLTFDGHGGVRTGDSAAIFDITEVEPGIWSVLLNGRSHIVIPGDSGYFLVDGHQLQVDVVDPRARRKRSISASVHGQQTLKAAMPCRIVRVLATEGAEVTAGQGIVVVEAMKMQNEVKSPKAGVVVNVPVREGATVSPAMYSRLLSNEGE